MALRDQHWDTIPAKLSNILIEENSSRFKARFTAEHKEKDIDFQWEGEISGNSSGHLVYSMDGVAKNSFLACRVGLCSLLPIENLAGKALHIEDISGNLHRETFPYFIAPEQPLFGNIRAISHEAVPGFKSTIRFEGDTFEIEDQRNWTDGSYKVYSRPLSLPYPIRLEKGDIVRQSITALIEPVPKV